MMKVSMWYNNQDIRTEDIPKPTPGPGEMLVKVMSCGICGSDFVEWYRLPRAPLVLGHEIGGLVVEVGKTVKKFKPGDKVFLAPKVPCMECHYCQNNHFPVCSNVKDRLPGGFSEYVLVPEAIVEQGAYLLPDSISYNQSTFIEPLACVIRSQKLADIVQHQSLMIMGCGMSGLLQIKLAKARKIKAVAVDIKNNRLEFAKKIGADIVIDASDDVVSRMVTENGKKADTVMLCTSAMSAIESAWQCVDKGGSIVFFAVPGPETDVVIPINVFWTNEIKVLTSYFCGPPDILEAMHLLETGAVKVDDMITHALPLDDIKTGFNLVKEGKESIKVIIKPNE
jgi:L-iditol 2-dehydrogenase